MKVPRLEADGRRLVVEQPPLRPGRVDSIAPLVIHLIIHPDHEHFEPIGIAQLRGHALCRPVEVRPWAPLAERLLLLPAAKTVVRPDREDGERARW